MRAAEEPSPLIRCIAEMNRDSHIGKIVTEAIRNSHTGDFSLARERFAEARAYLDSGAVKILEAHYRGTIEAAERRAIAEVAKAGIDYHTLGTAAPIQGE